MSLKGRFNENRSTTGTRRISAASSSTRRSAWEKVGIRLVPGSSGDGELGKSSICMFAADYGIVDVLLLITANENMVGSLHRRE
jgi:hypothetical protein